MKHTLIIFTLALCTLSCNKEFELNNPLDPDAEIDKPTDVQVLALDEISAILSWKFSTKYPHLFKQYIQVSADGLNFTTKDSVDANTTSINIFGPYFVEQKYFFRIIVQSQSGKFSYSTSDAKSIFFPPPTNLQITSMSTTQVNLSWSDNSTFETGFEIQQSSNNITYSEVKTVGANITSTTVAGSFEFATTHYFRIRAKSQYNVSLYSNTPSYNIAAFEAMLIFVEGGTFTMGSPQNVGGSDEYPPHSVTLSDFYIGKFEVTQKRWREVVQWKQGSSISPLNPNPSYFNGDSLPVEQVSWNDIQTWLEYLNERDGLTNSPNKYRLPTEAEWEYVARGGKNWSNNFTYSGSNTIENVAWYSSNSGSSTKTVGTKSPNQLGIYDMSGNVWEWCNDWYGAYSSSSQTNPTGPSTGSYRVLRGGSWYFSEYFCRVAVRYNITQDIWYNYYGFRYASNK